MKTLIAKLTNQQSREVLLLQERKNSLEELLLILDPEADSTLIAKAKNDQDETQAKIQAWWSHSSRALDWPTVPGAYYTLDFNTGEVFLHKDE